MGAVRSAAPRSGASPAPAAGRGPLLEARGIAKAWGGRHVLAGVDLTVGPGTLVAVTGANGTGKTTLLRICAGLIAADAGRVGVGGLDPSRDRAAYQRRVGFLAAGDRGLYARLTTRRHLDLWARVSLLGRRRPAAIERTVAALDLAPLLDRRLDRLSMGQRQRVRLAMAFLHEPDLVLLDEPLNSLDEHGRELLVGALAALGRRGGAAVCCSPAVVAGIPFDRALVLDGGRLRESSR
ncbi:MAG TPA: ABC transporter ATP-binding protein [Solirubrobacterales bacterium]|nr:ABC transporter ATP-binding protein [Solirubrobacterales bacterium]